MTGWTAREVPDLSGRTAVVTGGNSGIGYHTAKELADHGARVVVASRSADKGRAAVEAIGAGAEWAPLDLADLGSVRKFAEGVTGPLDLLINNAGVMMIPRQRTADGFEMQLGTNHLGHFALTGLLLPALLAAPAPRVVTVSSGEHHKGQMDFDDLMSERSYGPMKTYQRSKLANLLFVFELQRRADAAGANLLSVGAHPGFAATNLGHSGTLLSRLGVRIAQVVAAQPAPMGALPTLYAATAVDVRGGDYFGPDGRGEQRGYPKRVRASADAHDADAARRLWTVSEELTGVSFGALAAK